MNKLQKPTFVLDELEYNTLKPIINYTEYGRNVQNMIEELPNEPDREKRNRMAKGIVAVMSLLNPGPRDNEDHKIKLWDHLHIIGEYKLDIDGPYEKPHPEKILQKPQRVEYVNNRIKYRFYGKSVEMYLDKIADMPDSDEKNEYIKLLGSFMKSSCKSWNDENVSDQAIIEQINELSGGRLNLAYDGYRFSLDMARSAKSTNPLTASKFGNNKKNNRNKNKFKKRK